MKTPQVLKQNTKMKTQKYVQQLQDTVAEHEMLDVSTDAEAGLEEHVLEGEAAIVCTYVLQV